MVEINVNELIEEIVKGFEVAIKGAEQLEVLALKQVIGIDVQDKIEKLSIAMDLVYEKVNNLLGVAFKMQDTEVVDKIAESVAEVIKGKEKYLVVSLIAGGAL